MRVADRKVACRPFRPALLLSLLLAAMAEATAERLPVKHYTTADGLPRDTITRIVQDARGYLWFCSTEGLSRFDGYRFVNYGIEQGLPSRNVNDLIETRAGDYWLATNNGVCRFVPDPLPQTTAAPAERFVVYHLGTTVSQQIVNRICEDQAGTIWCGTNAGLYRLDQVNGQWVSAFVGIIRLVEGAWDPAVKGLMKDRRGDLWISTVFGLFRRHTDGHTDTFIIKKGLTGVLMEDRAGQVYFGTEAGLYQLVPDPKPGGSVVAHVYTRKDGLARDIITSLFQSSDGTLWVGTGLELNKFLPARDQAGRSFHTYRITDGFVITITEDRQGNLWLGTDGGGALKLAANGFITYGEADGLPGPRIASIMQNQRGLCVLSASAANDKPFISGFDSRRFSGTLLALPKGLSYWGWGWYQVMFEDSRGEWWMPTGEGLVRYPALSRLEQLAHARPKAIYTKRDGLLGELIFRLFEDSHGDIWVGTINRGDDGLTRWERATETFHRYSPADGIADAAPTAFCEDAAGNLWIGFYTGGLARYSAGRFTFFGADSGVPAGLIRGLYVDAAGRLWVASNEGGAARVDDPAAASPRFVTYTTANGLLSNQATCVTEDQWGMIYIGTGRGVARLDPATGRVKTYTAADGLASNFVNVALRDRTGALWFGTLNGISRLLPEPDRPAPPPSVRHRRVAHRRRPGGALRTRRGRSGRARLERQPQSDSDRFLRH
ncbi:MAG TPA: two-component regulator propeller domain-containing protein [Blastocatellia bacterium]|nr:two-component regulator propeller domain-containing protein [Blastocatellia bacterium]